MCYSPICQKQPGNKGTVFFSDISYATYRHTYCYTTSNLWIIPLNFHAQESMMTIIFPDKATSTVHLQQPFQLLRLSHTCSITSRYFHLPPHYKDHYMVMNVSLDTVNVNTINISTLDFRIWQHFSRNWTPPHLQKLANIPEVPVTQLYRNMINNGEPVHLFTIKESEDPSLIWTVLKYPVIYIGTISMIFLLCICVYCLKFWIRPPSPRCQPYSPVSLQHAIVDDNVEVASIYRCRNKAESP